MICKMYEYGVLFMNYWPRLLTFNFACIYYNLLCYFVAFVNYFMCM